MSDQAAETDSNDDPQDSKPDVMHLDPPEYDKVQESGKTEQFTHRREDGS